VTPSIDDHLAAARARLDRVSPEALDHEMAAGALVVDIRPIEQRQRDGELPGAIVIDRNVFEWRLDPTSEHRIAAVKDHDQRIIVVCNEGYSSSLAAEMLGTLGLTRATDLAGGYQAWKTITRPMASAVAEPAAVATDVTRAAVPSRIRCVDCGHVIDDAPRRVGAVERVGCPACGLQLVRRKDEPWTAIRG
jgi:rhodanese-related sulfurtransferase